MLLGIGDALELQALCEHWRTKQHRRNDDSDSHGIPLEGVVTGVSLHARRGRETCWDQPTPVSFAPRPSRINKIFFIWNP